MLCKRLEITWPELQAMPEDTVDVWEAVMIGEGHAAMAARALAK